MTQMKAKSMVRNSCQNLRMINFATFWADYQTMTKTFLLAAVTLRNLKLWKCSILNDFLL